MRNRLCITLVVLFAIGFGSMTVSAQGVARINVPFAFVAGSTELPAGDYEIRVLNQDGNQLAILRLADRQTFNVPVITRISAREGKTAQVVFDKSDKNYMAEVYLPGIDGFHLQGAPGKHTHTKVVGK